MQIIKIHPQNPESKYIKEVVKVLKIGGIIIYPTDTVYAIGCHMMNKKAINKLYQITGKKPKKSDLSVVCCEIKYISNFTLPFGNNVYKIMKKCFPGPYTVILKANNNIPKIFEKNKKTIGVKIPSNKIPIDIVHELGNPLVTASVKEEDDILQYTADPHEISDKIKNQVDIIIDGGFGDVEPSTIIDCSNDTVEIVRQGKGEIFF